MPALINFKICDNAKECSGIEICPTHAMHYDEDQRTIVIDKDKCTSCGLCAPKCPVSAIYVAKTEEEYQRYKEEIEKDKRTIKDLFVDRYGASPISDFFMIDESQIEDKTLYQGITIIEMYNGNLTECLLKSIPIRDITDEIDGDIRYYKLDGTNIKEKYKIEELPPLLIFKSGKLIGKIEGYFNQEQKDLFKNKIVEIINKGENTPA